jgi:aminopeptidase
MHPDFNLRLRALAGVIVRVGLNMQPGQPLMISDPYDMQGVHPEAAAFVDAVRAVAPGDTTVIPGDPARLRTLIEADDLIGFESLVSSHIHRLIQHLAKGGAFLFLPGCHPGLFADLPADRLGRFHAIKWQYLGPLIQTLLKGVTQWTLATVPTSPWANLAFSHLPEKDRLPALWNTVFQAMRVETHDGNGAVSPDGAVTAWHTHLSALARAAAFAAVVHGPAHEQEGCAVRRKPSHGGDFHRAAPLFRHGEGAGRPAGGSWRRGH